MTGTVCHRELRALGRFWGTYWLRVLAGLTVGGALALGLLAARAVRMSGPQAGAVVFAAIHGTLVFLLALVSPLLPADTMARERRDGTLGLLFLTPLSPADVVAGKCAAQIVRAAMLWVAALPLLSVPVLLGGLTPENLLWAAGLEMGVLLCGLGAGLMATSRARAWTVAMTRAVLALVVATLCGAAVVAVVVSLSLRALAPVGTDLPRGWEQVGFPMAVLFGLPLHGAGGTGTLGTLGLTVPTWAIQSGRAGGASFIAFSFVWFFSAVGWLLFTVGGESRREAGPADGPGFRRGTGWGRRVRGRHSAPGGNPLVWLQARAPGAWWTSPAWVIVVLVLWIPIVLLILRSDPEYRHLGWAIPPAMLVALALAASGSYRREIEEGTLELLLVTTLPPARLVTGRLWWLGCGFGPGLLVAWLVAGWFNDQEEWRMWIPAVWLTATSLLALPLVGLRCALRRVHPLNGWLITGLWGVAFPAIVAGIVTVVVAFSDWITGEWARVWLYAAAAGAAQLALAGWWGWLCARELADRSFLKRPLAR